MPLGTFIAGPYNATWNSTTVGIVERGFTLRLRAEKEVITDTHLYGDTIVDCVYRGGNCMLGTNFMEHGISTLPGTNWPYGPAASGAATALIPAFGYGYLGTVGRMDVASSIAKALVLTAVSGTTAAALPATLTATLTARAEGDESQWVMGSTLRKHPIVLRLYPYQVTNPTGYAAGTYEVFFIMA